MLVTPLKTTITTTSSTEDGFMSSQDKIKLDAATSQKTGNTLALRDALGSIAFNKVTADIYDLDYCPLCLVLLPDGHWKRLRETDKLLVNRNGESFNTLSRTSRTCRGIGWDDIIGLVTEVDGGAAPDESIDRPRPLDNGCIQPPPPRH